MPRTSAMCFTSSTMRGTGVGSPGYQAYIAKTGYHVVDPATYGKPRTVAVSHVSGYLPK